MKGFAGLMRIYLRHAAVLLAFGALLQIAGTHTRAQQPARPRITGIDHVRLYVSDIDKSREFYLNALGLTTPCPHQQAAHPCFLVHGTTQRIELTLAPQQPKGSALKNWLAEVGFATDNVAQMRRYLVAHGSTPGLILTDSDRARHFTIRDPEGNAIAFVQRPASRIGYGPASKQISSRLIHAGFVVKNLDAENRFYQDLLGFRLYWKGGFKDAGLDWYEIQVPDGDNWIEYMLNIPDNADHQELGVQNHFSLAVTDANVAAAQLRKNGLAKFDGPEIGRDGKNSLDAYDPDGTRVEVMEFTPRQKPCCSDYSASHPKP